MKMTMALPIVPMDEIRRLLAHHEDLAHGCTEWSPEWSRHAKYAALIAELIAVRTLEVERPCPRCSGTGGPCIECDGSGFARKNQGRR